MRTSDVAVGDVVTLEAGRLRYPDVGPYEVVSVHVGDEADPPSAVLKHKANGQQRREPVSVLRAG